MNYDVTHITRYRYGATVEMMTGVLRLKPRSGEGQAVTSATIVTEPQAAETLDSIDAFGNHVTRLRISAPLRELVITSRSRVAVSALSYDAPTPPWRNVAAEALASRSLGPDSPALGIYPSRLVPLFDEATRYARASFPPLRPVHDAAMELTRRIHADFAYDPSATEVTTTPAEAFAKRRGVCQDYAHVMIAALRGLGLPALYVSGYIRTLPKSGESKLVGADASHAWVALWCGEASGWRAYDPTNAVPSGEDHVTVARGRDYSDVAPVEGVILSSGKHDLDVEVHVVPV